MSRTYDVVIIGGGIVGLATAMALVSRTDLSVVILEAEKRVASHQTGHNSGVIHSGLYYAPGSLKARNCVEGREAMVRFCEEHRIAHEQCGKVVVATREEEIPRLDALEARGRANGLEGLQRLRPEELREHEPHVRGVDGLFVPQTGIVDFKQVASAMAQVVTEAGGEIRTRARVRRCRRTKGRLVLETPNGDVIGKFLVNCGGLECDRIARMCGVDPGLRIVPFRGEYYEIVPERRGLVRNLIYPVPDPRFPFLGVHFTRTIYGGVEAGPNAVLALRRDGYSKWSVSLRDACEIVGYAGFRRLARKYWRTGLMEAYRSWSRRAFVAGLQRLIPEIRPQDVRPGGAGVRAQAVGPDGKLADDFRIVEADRMVHVLNAPSPAATASITIGQRIAEIALRDMSAR